MYMYCQINQLLPISIISNFTRNEDVHYYETRNRDPIHYTHRRTAQISKTYHHTSPRSSGTAYLRIFKTITT